MHRDLAYGLRPVAVAALSVALMAAASAQQSDPKVRQRQRAAPSHQAAKPQPVARPRPTPCSEFGAGFVRMPGSDSCIRFGGGVGIGVGAVP